MLYDECVYTLVPFLPLQTNVYIGLGEAGRHGAVIFSYGFGMSPSDSVLPSPALLCLFCIIILPKSPNSQKQTQVKPLNRPPFFAYMPFSQSVLLFLARCARLTWKDMFHGASIRSEIILCQRTLRSKREGVSF